VLAAAELASVGSGELTVLLPPVGQEAGNHLGKQVADLLNGTDIRIRYKHTHSSEAGFRAALRSERPSVIVLTGAEPFSDKASLVALFDEIGVSALFLSQTPFHTGA
jgi:microsomal dipeptidase-like Zn-dependent dipeptidase